MTEPALRWMRECYQVLNRTYFKAALPMVTLDFHPDSEPLGLCTVSYEGDNHHISLSRVFLDASYRYPLHKSNRLAGDVLLHEMLHLQLVQVNKFAHVCDCHGSQWITACQQLAPKIGLYLDAHKIPRDAWAYFPHAFTRPAYYLEQSNTRRKIGDTQTVYDLTQEKE